MTYDRYYEQDCEACGRTHTPRDVDRETDEDVVYLYYKCSVCEFDGQVAAYKQDDGSYGDEEAHGDYFLPPRQKGP